MTLVPSVMFSTLVAGKMHGFEFPSLTMYEDTSEMKQKTNTLLEDTEFAKKSRREMQILEGN